MSSLLFWSKRMGESNRFKPGDTDSIRLFHGGLLPSIARRSSESRHFDQISTVIMIRNGIVNAVLIFYSKALIYKAFLLSGTR